MLFRSPLPPCPLENKAQCHPPKSEAAWGGGRRMAAMPPGLWHTAGGCPTQFQGDPRLPTPTPLPSCPPPRWGAGVPLSSPAPPRTRAAVSTRRLTPQQATPESANSGVQGPRQLRRVRRPIFPDSPGSAPCASPRPSARTPGPNSPRGGGGGGARDRGALGLPGRSGKWRCRSGWGRAAGPDRKSTRLNSSH